MKIKPLRFGPSLLFFAIPSAIAAFGVYVVMQRLDEHGVNNFINFYLSLIIPLALMLVAALIAFKMEGNPLKWKILAKRFRLKRMTKKDWIYTLVLFIIQLILYAGLSFTAKWLIQLDLFAPPEFLLPAVDPRIEQGILPDSFIGVPLKGHWIETSRIDLKFKHHENRCPRCCRNCLSSERYITNWESIMERN